MRSSRFQGDGDGSPRGRARPREWSRLQKWWSRLLGMDQAARGGAEYREVEPATRGEADSKVVEQAVGDGSDCKKLRRVGGAGYKGWSRPLEAASVGADSGG
jgi:hypothetical protein